MAKADEAMKPDKPLEQSEINHVVLDQIVRQQEELDRQADEIKRLKELLKLSGKYLSRIGYTGLIKEIEQALNGKC